ncbi:hypothetical protein ILUMI_05144 [Ignelater luminosus]|uniref:DUF4817 domain-containing protein n=1 Tax=Ignelater luminosus TaxID=2038154 RepID=A0A8K0DDH3_IGNLU|nr:hypothetical protein ILUMI_05144 [Ignelater luminosus]
MVYTLPKKVEIIFIYGAENRIALSSATVFNARHHGQNVSHKYVCELISKFDETGSVAITKRAEPRILDDDLGQFASTVMEICPEPLRKVHKLHTFFLYKMQIVQKLTKNDYDR